MRKYERKLRLLLSQVLQYLPSVYNMGLSMPLISGLTPVAAAGGEMAPRDARPINFRSMAQVLGGKYSGHIFGLTNM